MARVGPARGDMSDSEDILRLVNSKRHHDKAMIIKSR